MEKDYIENNTVDGNNPINWEEIIKDNVDISNRKRPMISDDYWKEIRDSVTELVDQHETRKK